MDQIGTPYLDNKPQPPTSQEPNALPSADEPFQWLYKLPLDDALDLLRELSELIGWQEPMNVTGERLLLRDFLLTESPDQFSDAGGNGKKREA